MRGGRTGATKTSALLVPVLWAGRGFSRIPRTFLPPNPTREGTTSDRPRELGAEQHSSTAAQQHTIWIPYTSLCTAWPVFAYAAAWLPKRTRLVPYSVRPPLLLTDDASQS